MSTILRRRRSLAVLAAAVLGFGMASVAIPQAAHADVTVNPTADSYVKKSGANSNFGLSNPLEALGSPASAQRYSFMMYNVTIPAGQTVTGVTLKLYMGKITTGQMFVDATTSGWTETGITWNNQPAIGTELARITTPTVTGYVSITLPTTSVVNGNNSFVVQETNSATNIQFYSREDATRKPQLVVTTSVSQAPPTVVTNAATGITSSGATLNGSVNPNGAASTYHFEYGPTTAYGTNVPVPDGSAGSGTVAVNESAAITGLAANTLYHYRLDATNSGGTTNGADMTFTTSVGAQSPPTVTTGAASSVGTTTATLNGTVNPNGAASTYHFEYGPTTGYGTSIPVPDGSAGSGTTAVNESANLTGLTANTLYHFRLDATNSGGTTNGSDATFTTLATSVLNDPAYLKCTEVGAWEVSAGGSPTTVDPVATATRNAGFKCIRIAVGDCFVGSTCGTNNHAGTINRADFDLMIQRIRDNLQPTMIWFKLLPIAHDFPDTTTATSFCPPWTGAADGNLAMYKDQVNEIKVAGWSGPIAIELSNEMYYDCTSGTTGPWDVQSGTNLGGGSVGVSNRVGQHFAANAGPLKTYAQGLGFGEVVVGDDIGVPGGAQWGQSFVTDPNGPFGYTWTYSTRWIDEFNNGDKNALGITPDFEAWHSYVHSPDNYAAAPYESTLGDPNSATDDDQILYSYVRGQITKYRSEVNTIWGTTAGNPIRFAISEGAAGSANSGGTWSGWTTGTRAPDFYSGWLNMLTGDGNLTGTGTRYWEYTVFCDACNSSAPGNDYDVIKPDGTTSNYYSTFQNFVP